MRKKDIITLAVIVIGVLIFNFASVRIRAEPVDTYQQGWQLVRETDTEDGATFAAVYDLAGGEGDFAGMESPGNVIGGGSFHLKSQRSDLGQYGSVGTRWQFIVCGGLADQDDFSYTLVGWADKNGPLQILTEGTGIIGTQDVVIFPDGGAATNTWWADTLTVDTGKWTAAAGGANGVSVFNSGDNEIAVIQLYPQGIAYIQFIFYDADDSQAGEADPLTVYGRRI